MTDQKLDVPLTAATTNSVSSADPRQNCAELALSGSFAPKRTRSEEALITHNPFRARVHDFPGRLFPGVDQVAERAEIDRIRGQSAQTLVEIGSGSGMHVIELARQHPGAAVFGFEIRFKRAVRTLEKAERAGVHNVYILRVTGEDLAAYFPEQSLAGVYVNYPDPWPKERWHKHRMLSARLLDVLKVRLATQGYLAAKTDHQEYFEQFAELLATRSDYRITEFSKDLYASPYLERNIQTEFERLFLSQELPLCYLRCELSRPEDQEPV